MSTDKKLLLGGLILTIVIISIGGFYITKQEQRLTSNLIGEEISTSRGHVPEGTKIQYNSDPPAGGEHYAVTQPAGIYNNAPADGKLVHSLEHGAVILWYNPEKITKDQINELKKIFAEAKGKRIMTPRKNMEAPIAVSSWGRVMKFTKIDKKKILEFFENNRDRAPENAPI